MTEPFLKKVDLAHLMDEYMAGIDVEVGEELEAWGVEWDGLSEMMDYFAKSTLQSIKNNPTEHPIFSLYTLFYTGFALGIKCAMEQELRRRAAEEVS
jgi:hypothetical protein